MSRYPPRRDLNALTRCRNTSFLAARLAGAYNGVGNGDFELNRPEIVDSRVSAYGIVSPFALSLVHLVPRPLDLKLLQLNLTVTRKRMLRIRPKLLDPGS
jgi:hypothetical protein